MRQINMTLNFVIEVPDTYSVFPATDFFIELDKEKVRVGRMVGQAPYSIPGNVITYETISTEECE